MDKLEFLISEWENAKMLETAAINKRRDVEDKIVELMHFDNTVEGTTHYETGSAKITLNSRLSRTIDSDELQELAIEHGLMDHLQHLFRWKPEINMKEWKAADPSITKPLEKAITVKPGRPTFKATHKED